MNKIENKLLDSIIKRINIIYIVIAILVSFALRYLFFPFISSDMEGFLIGWYGQLQQLGGMKGLAVQVGNYSVAYQTFIAIMTELSIPAVIGYKVFSCIFDYVLALGVYFILKKDTDPAVSKNALIGFTLIIFSPLVFINSAMWGQCDSIYTSFLVLSYLMYTKKKYPLCFVFFGLSFAFKLQAIFALPFLLFAYLYDRKFTVLNFLLTPITMIAVCIPAYINGRGFKGFISPYYYQTESCDKVFFNYPSFWSLFPFSPDRAIDYISAIKYPAIILTFVILLTLMFVIIKKNISMETNSLNILMLFIYTCVEFLPGMHERYAFPIEILSIILAIKNKKTIPLAIALNVLSFITYGVSLYGGTVNYLPLGVANFIVYLMYIVFLFNPGFTLKQSASKQA